MYSAGDLLYNVQNMKVYSVLEVTDHGLILERSGNQYKRNFQEIKLFFKKNKKEALKIYMEEFEAQLIRIIRESFERIYEANELENHEM